MEKIILILFIAISNAIYAQGNLSYSFNNIKHNERTNLAIPVEDDKIFVFGSGIIELTPSYKDGNYIMIIDRHGQILKNYYIPYISAIEYYNYKVFRDTFYFLGRTQEYPHDLCLLKSNLNADSIFFRVLYANNDRNIAETAICFDDENMYLLIDEKTSENGKTFQKGKLLKTDFNGNITLTKTFNEVENFPDFPENRNQVNYFINVIFMSDETLLLSSIDNRKFGDWTPSLIKTDLNGEIIWRNAFNHARSSTLFSGPIELKNKDIVFGWNKDYSDTLIAQKPNMYPPVVYCLDKYGNKKWQYVFETFPSWHRKNIVEMIETENGDILGVGYYIKIDHTPNKLAWMFRMDNTGNVLWEKTYYDENYKGGCFFSNVTETQNGDLLLTGEIIDLVSDLDLNDRALGWVLKLDKHGCFYPGCDPDNDLEIIKSRSFDSIPEFAPVGAEWYYEGYSNIIGKYVGGFEKDIVSKDTLIENKVCKIIERSYYTNTDSTIKNRLILHQENNRIYSYFNGRFNLYFDYNWKAGDTARIPRWREGKESALAKIISVEKQKYKNDSLRVWLIELEADSCINVDYPFMHISFNEKFGPMNENLAYNEMDFFDIAYNYYDIRCYSDKDFGSINFTGLSCDSIRVSTRDISPLPALAIYPNPANDHITISFENPETIVEIMIYNVFGQMQNIIGNKSNNININDLPHGLYILLLKDNAGRLWRGKFVKR